MNPASRIWDIPPPPGTEDDIPLIEKDLKPQKEVPITKECQKSLEKETTLERAIDRINPYLKNPEYVEYEKRRHERRHRSRSRSYSRERYHRRKYSRSRSRDRYHSSKAKSRRSRSRSRHRRRRYTSSRSRSRSPSYRRHKYRKRSYSRSKSRSKSASRSRHVSRKRSEKDKKSRSQSRSPKIKQEPAPDVDTNEVDMKIEEEEDDSTKDNVFKNDGTFLEMFKKMQEQQQKVVEKPAPVESKKVLPVFGKRRGGKVLKTGLVKKPKLPNEEEGGSEDAWSVYMKEVRRYKEACCDDDSKTRPLVK